MTTGFTGVVEMINQFEAAADQASAVNLLFFKNFSTSCQRVVLRMVCEVGVLACGVAWCCALLI
jgi:hypothetical protein